MTDLIRNLLVSSDPIIFEINQKSIKHRHQKLRPEVIQLLGEDCVEDIPEIRGRATEFGDCCGSDIENFTYNSSESSSSDESDESDYTPDSDED